MTEENYNYRTSQTLLRNQFPGSGKWRIPAIPRFQEEPGDFEDLLLIGFDKTHLEDQKHLIGGQAYLPHDTMSAFRDIPLRKGGGSAYGGKWQPNPNKPKDQRFIGEAGETKVTTNAKGELYETHIGEDGRADYETHHSDHGNPSQHMNPHTHDIIWDEIGPRLIPVEHGKKNYSRMERSLLVKSFVPSNTPEQNRFVSISDYKWCLLRGGEVHFVWKGVEYGMTPYEKDRYMVYLYDQPETTAFYDSPERMLDYMVGEDRLRDVITKVTVLDRTI